MDDQLRLPRIPDRVLVDTHAIRDRVRNMRIIATNIAEWRDELDRRRVDKTTRAAALAEIVMELRALQQEITWLAEMAK